MELVPVSNQVCPFCGMSKLTVTWMISKAYGSLAHSLRFNCKECKKYGLLISEDIVPEIADEY